MEDAFEPHRMNQKILYNFGIRSLNALRGVCVAVFVVVSRRNGRHI